MPRLGVRREGKLAVEKRFKGRSQQNMNKMQENEKRGRGKEKRKAMGHGRRVYRRYKHALKYKTFVRHLKATHSGQVKTYRHKH